VVKNAYVLNKLKQTFFSSYYLILKKITKPGRGGQTLKFDPQKQQSFFIKRSISTHLSSNPGCGKKIFFPVRKNIFFFLQPGTVKSSWLLKVAGNIYN